MSSASVIEFAHLVTIPGAQGAVVPVGRFDGQTIYQTVITLSTASQSSSVFSTTTNFIRVNTSGICNFFIGATTSTASVGGPGRMTAGQTEYFGVCPGQIISFITDT